MTRVLPAGSVLVPEVAQKVFSGQIFDVYQWSQQQFDGSTKTFEMLKRPDTVQVLVVDGNQVLLINDEQPGKAVSQHFPGGRVDPDEDWLPAAQRELSEETGIVCANWRLVDVQQPATKIEWFTPLFLATNITERGPQSVDTGGEKITPVWQDFASLRKRLLGGGLPTLRHLSLLFSTINSVEELLALSEFKGQVKSN